MTKKHMIIGGIALAVIGIGVYIYIKRKKAPVIAAPTPKPNVQNKPVVTASTLNNPVTVVKDLASNA